MNKQESFVDLNLPKPFIEKEIDMRAEALAYAELAELKSAKG